MSENFFQSKLVINMAAIMMMRLYIYNFFETKRREFKKSTKLTMTQVGDKRGEKVGGENPRTEEREEIICIIKLLVFWYNCRSTNHCCSSSRSNIGLFLSSKNLYNFFYNYVCVWLFYKHFQVSVRLWVWIVFSFMYFFYFFITALSSLPR